MTQQLNKRILVAYASHSGSTIDVAARIGETLTARGFSVDIKPIMEKPQVESYGAVVIGSAIRYGQWLPVATEFVKTNQVALQRVPVALFSVHLMNRGNDEQSRVNRLAYLNTVRSLIKPVDEVFFSGKGDPKRLSLFDRWISRAAGAPVGDLRDWNKIRGWAQAVFA